jgi:hypothetical protein
VGKSEHRRNTGCGDGLQHFFRHRCAGAICTVRTCACGGSSPSFDTDSEASLTKAIGFPLRIFAKRGERGCGLFFPFGGSISVRLDIEAVEKLVDRGLREQPCGG